MGEVRRRSRGVGGGGRKRFVLCGLGMVNLAILNFRDDEVESRGEWGMEEIERQIRVKRSGKGYLLDRRVSMVLVLRGARVDNYPHRQQRRRTTVPGQATCQVPVLILPQE